jgi:hypothetical protein
MDASLLAVLNDAERLMVAETDRDNLTALDEDAAIELETRIRRARNKYVGQYRRAASAKVAELGGRGRARPENTRARTKAEAFEEALSRVSRRVAVLARQSAAQLRRERLAAARAVQQGRGPGQRSARSISDRAISDRAISDRARTDQAILDQAGAAAGAEDAAARALRSPRTEKQRAGTLAMGARRQAKRDSR